MTGIFRLMTAILMLAGIPHIALADGSHMTVVTKKGNFAEVREAVEMAITGHGFVINNVSHIGDMLERTGKDLGGGKQVFLKAESLEFCSATVSRQMMEADPDNIVFCPYIIAIYVVPTKPEEVRVAYRNTLAVGSQESQKSLKAVNELLSSIIKEAVE